MSSTSKRYRQLGLCVDCGLKPFPNRTRCRGCLVRAAIANRMHILRKRTKTSLRSRLDRLEEQIAKIEQYLATYNYCDP